jgi:hypothetical protein
MNSSMSYVQVCVVDIIMALVASSLASKLNLWVKTDDSFTTDGKIII